jgi:hypothetical protein
MLRAARLDRENLRTSPRLSLEIDFAKPFLGGPKQPCSQKKKRVAGSRLAALLTPAATALQPSDPRRESIRPVYDAVEQADRVSRLHPKRGSIFRQLEPHTPVRDGYAESLSSGRDAPRSSVSLTTASSEPLLPITHPIRCSAINRSRIGAKTASLARGNDRRESRHRMDPLSITRLSIFSPTLDLISRRLRRGCGALKVVASRRLSQPNHSIILIAASTVCRWTTVSEGSRGKRN